MPPSLLSTIQQNATGKPSNASVLSEETLAGRRLSNAPPGEEVCVTGIAGKFPECENVHELRESLFSKKNLITSDDRRWDRAKGQPDLPKAGGKIEGLSKFDASFFGFHLGQAECSDPLTRMFLEKSYEAIVDAGVNPAELHGTRTGVFVGACFSESEPSLYFDVTPVNGKSLLSSTRISYGQRVAYWLQTNGPCYTVDSACSSSLYALDHAYKAIRDGGCDQAIVVGGGICLKPFLTLQFMRLGVLSDDACCKTFDEDADGYGRSEAISAMFLQKTRDARRVYATVVYSKTNNDGFKEQGITFPSSRVQTKLLSEFYQECDVDPTTLAWVEAHGTGTKVGDPEECGALISVFCNGRDKPLPIGSIKSNLGHTEPVSGLCSIAKVVIAMETGLIPPNINFNRPKLSVPGLVDGRLQVVTEAQAWDGGLVGINSFGFGGANAHVCLRWNDKTKVGGGAPRDQLTRMVVVSGRTERSVRAMIDDLCSRPVDVELAYLYHALAARETPGHVFRGYVLLKPSKPVKHVQGYDKQSRPVWLSFPALEFQRWPGMGDALAALSPFASALAECQVALDAGQLQTSVSLRDLLAAGPLVNRKHQILASVVVQIGLASVLRAVGVVPVSVLGSGSGELAAGYAAGCLTAGQAVLAAFYLGVAQDQGVDGIEARLTEILGQVLTTPVARPSCWRGFETFVSASSLSRALLTRSDPNAVVRLAPRNGVVLHATADPQDNKKHTAMSIVLMKRGGDEVEQLLLALGNLYVAGGNNGAGLALAELYPRVALPVSRGTPMIAPHVDWEHSRDWYTDLFFQNSLKKTQETSNVINIEKAQFAFYRGHVIDGRNLFPATGYLFLTWENLVFNSATEGKVIFENVRFHRATTLPPTGNLELLVSIHKSSGKFEVVEGDVKVVTGRVYLEATSEKKELDVPLQDRSPKGQEESIAMDAKDIYKELRLRGYNYSGLFKGLVSADLDGCRGKIRWANDNWIAFMDNMLQMQVLHGDTRGLFVPTGIARLTINASKHLRVAKAQAEIDGETDPILDIEVIKEAKLIRSGGIEIIGLTASTINMRKYNAEPVLESYQFLPFKTGAEDSFCLPLALALRTCVHVGLENRVGGGVEVKVVELVDSEHRGEPLAPIVAAVLADLPLIRANIMLLSAAEESSLESSLGPVVRLVSDPLENQESCNFVLASRVLGRPKVLSDAMTALAADGFLLARELPETHLEPDAELQVLVEHYVGDEKFVLIRKRTPSLSHISVCMREESGDWIAQTQEALRVCKKDGRVVLFAQNEPLSGLLGAFNCLSKEHSGNYARCVLISDESAPPFDVALPLYRDQLSLDLKVNVYSNGRWGSFRHFPLEANSEVSVAHAYANTATRGDLSSFRWFEGPLSCPALQLPPHTELVHVYYSALNFRDVMIASGKLNADVVGKKGLSNDCFQGLEFSGRRVDGRRVMGITQTCSQASMALVSSDLTWDIPDEWCLEDAATVPVVYATVACAMQVKGRMQRGESILIHSGTGGVGQAAIHLALHGGLTVYTTVGTAEKRAFIKKLFPTITDAHIGNSRDTSFEQLVMRETNGRGVDLVLNSLAEEKLQASVRCLAVGGRFLEIGKFDLANNNEIALELFNKEISFHGVFLDYMIDGPGDYEKPVHDLVKMGICEGFVLPLARTTFPAEDIEQAYRFMGMGKHMGKVLLKVRDEEPEKTVVPKPLLMKAVPRFCCQPQSTYIIVGGLGGFGLELAHWLVLRGARQIVLVSRSGLRNGYQTSRIRTWRSYGVDVHVSVADVKTEEGVVDLLTMANDLGPVSAIFNLAVVLQDALFENQTRDRFTTAAGPKALATRLLDSVSRRLCPRLEHFVVFSSVSCGRGNAGQTSYGAANSTMERICEQRAQDGLPALAVQWGAVGQVGLVADMRDDDKEVVIGGTLPQRISSCLAALDGFLRQKLPVVASMVVAEKLAGGPADSMPNRVAGILGIRDLKKVSYLSTFAELGMDSMTAVEIKQTLEREYQVFLTPGEIRGLTFARIFELSADETQPQTSVTESNPAGIAHLKQSLGDERSAYAPTVSLPSRQTPSLPTTDGRTLLMIPGLEGMASGLQPLAQNIDAHAVCLQGDWWTDKSETVLGMAQMMLPHALHELADSPDFLLLGYSFGGSVSLHLAAMLEADGRRGRVFIVDGAPDYLQQILKAVAVEDSEAALEADLLIGMISLMQKQDLIAREKIHEAILTLPTWSERLDYTISQVPEGMFNKQYLRDAGNAAMRRLRAVGTFDWPAGLQIESPVTLLRPTYKNLKLPLDLGVNKYCKNPVDVHLFDETHVSILESMQMATIINDQITRLACDEKRR